MRAFNFLFFLIFASSIAEAKLEGNFRKEFVTETKKSCYANQRQADENKSLTNKQIGQFCQCYALYLADLPNTDVIYGLAMGTRRLSDLSSSIELAFQYCIKNYHKY